MERVAELVKTNAAAAEKAAVELAKVRAEAAATKLAQKLGQLQPFIAAFLLECMGQPRIFLGQPNTLLAAVGGAAPVDRAGGGGAGLGLIVALC